MVMTLQKLRKATIAWERHITKSDKQDNKKFIVWIVENFSVEQIAIIIDSDIRREDLWEIYQKDVYGIDKWQS